MSRPPKSPPPDLPSGPNGHWEDRRWRRFADAWRREIERPPQTPPEEAAAEILARLDERRRHRRGRLTSPVIWGPVLAGACALLVVLTLRPSAPPESPPRAPRVLAASEPGPDELIFWLDPETPLHFTLEPSVGESDDVSRPISGDPE